MKISVQVKPGTHAREEVIASDEGYTVYTKARAVDGKANEAVVKLLAKHFKVPRSRVKLVRGMTSRHKVFEIDILYD